MSELLCKHCNSVHTRHVNEYQIILQLCILYFNFCAYNVYILYIDVHVLEDTWNFSIPWWLMILSVFSSTGWLLAFLLLKNGYLDSLLISEQDCMIYCGIYVTTYILWISILYHLHSLKICPPNFVDYLFTVSVVSFAVKKLLSFT